jgi:hypothetical protein
MLSLTLWLLKRYFPGHALIDVQDGKVLTGVMDITVIRLLLAEYAPGFHLTRSQGKGSRKAKREAEKQAVYEFELSKAADRQRDAITKSFRKDRSAHEDPQADTLGD